MRARPLLRGIEGVTGLLLVATAFGCVMPDQISRLEKDVADLSNELRKIAASQTEADAKFAKIDERAAAAESAPSRSDLADLGERVVRLDRESSISTQKFADLDRRLDAIAQELSQALALSRRAASGSSLPDRVSGSPAMDPAVPAPSNSQATPGAVPDPEALYNTAYADFSKGSYALAVAGFEEYLERFPENPQADTAQYWIGECLFSQGNYPEAVAAFDKLLDRFPTSEKLAAANLKKALAFLEQHQVGQAIVQLRYVIKTFPETDESRIARDKLASLGVPA